MGCGIALARAAKLGLGLIALVLALALLLPTALGYSRYVITGSSMAGSYDRGSIVLAREVPISELAVGDVITYVPPSKAGLTTHRIARITPNRNGVPVFQTKGDANEKADPWTFKLDADEQARVSFSVPYVGYLIAGLSIREVRMAVVGIPALLIAMMLIVRLWRESAPPPTTSRPPQASSPP